MKNDLKEIAGNWNLGYSLDKHVLSSVFTGDNQYGHPTFDTTRSEIGEAIYQLKYRNDWTQVEPLAKVFVDCVFPRFKNIGLLIPMPPSTRRSRQPVLELTTAIGAITKTPVFDNILSKTTNGIQLKNITGKEAKIEILKDSFTITDGIQGNGPWNALIIDDLYDTGATLEVACSALKGYPKIKSIFVATFTWK